MTTLSKLHKLEIDGTVRFRLMNLDVRLNNLDHPPATRLEELNVTLEIPVAMQRSLHDFDRSLARLLVHFQTSQLDQSLKREAPSFRVLVTQFEQIAAMKIAPHIHRLLKCNQLQFYLNSIENLIQVLNTIPTERI